MILINNNTLTVQHEGTVYSKEVSQEELTMVKVYALDNDYQSIIDLCFPTPQKLLKREGFWEEDGSIYYKNIKVSIPQILTDKLMKAEEEFDRLIKFWGWLSLNPNPRSRENLYSWIGKNDIQLTNEGLMILYRRVWKVESALDKFVKETYERLRRQKKSTNVSVYLYDQDYTLKEEEEGERCTYVGNLKELYHQPKEQVFTDNYTKQERYILGQESRMKRDIGDESKLNCSKGYHSSGIDFSYSGYGDTPIAILVNPMDVLNCNVKVRSCAFTPLAVLNEDCEWINDPEVHKRIDAIQDYQVERLQELLDKAEFEDFKKHTVLKDKWNLSVGFETVIKILN